MSKTLSLLLSLIMIALFILTHHSTALTFGLTASSPTFTRLTYPMFHASTAHIVINTYCLLSLTFLSNAKPWQLLSAFMIAWLVPSIITSDSPMLGISVVNFALTGLILPSSNRWPKLLLINAIPITLSFLMPNIAAAAHLYGIMAGFIIGFITTPRYNV